MQCINPNDAVYKICCKIQNLYNILIKIDNTGLTGLKGATGPTGPTGSQGSAGDFLELYEENFKSGMGLVKPIVSGNNSVAIGINNKIADNYSFIGGGKNNITTLSGSPPNIVGENLILGGLNNNVGDVVIGTAVGSNNFTQGYFASIFGGNLCTIEQTQTGIFTTPTIIIGGYDNTILANRGGNMMINGAEHGILNSGYSSIIGGFNNYIREGQYQTILNSSNTKLYETSGYSFILSGIGNRIKYGGYYNIISGISNYIYNSSHCLSMGKNNGLYSGAYCLISGYDNRIYGDDSAGKPLNCFVFGKTNTILTNSKNIFIHGDRNIVSTDCYNITIFGYDNYIQQGIHDVVMFGNNGNIVRSSSFYAQASHRKRSGFPPWANAYWNPVNNQVKITISQLFYLSSKKAKDGIDEISVEKTHSFHTLKPKCYNFMKNPEKLKIWYGFIVDDILETNLLPELVNHKAREEENDDANDDTKNKNKNKNKNRNRNNAKIKNENKNIFLNSVWTLMVANIQSLQKEVDVLSSQFDSLV